MNAAANSGLMSTSRSCCCSSLRLRSCMAFVTIPLTASVSMVYRTSHTHFLSRCCQSLSSGRYRSSAGFLRACYRKSSTVRPSICGTAATFTADRLMYFTVRDDTAYLLHAACDLLEEEHVDGVELRQVGLAFDGQEVVDILLGRHLLHDLIHIDLLESRL